MLFVLHPLRGILLTPVFLICFLVDIEFGKSTSNSPVCPVWCLGHGWQFTWFRNEFPESHFHFMPVKVSWKCAMEYSLEISGMLELVPEVVGTKNIGLDQVMEGSVL